LRLQAILSQFALEFIAANNTNTFPHAGSAGAAAGSSATSRTTLNGQAGAPSGDTAAALPSSGLSALQGRIPGCGLVIFQTAIMHLARITRVLSMDQVRACLLAFWPTGWLGCLLACLLACLLFVAVLWRFFNLASIFPYFSPIAIAIIILNALTCSSHVSIVP
jgi:hypothetical protein